MKTCVILGAGGHAREIYWNSISTNPFDNYIFVDEITDEATLLINNKVWKIEKKWDFSDAIKNSSEIGFIAGVGDTKVKIQLVKKALDAGLTALPSIVHPSVIILDPTCKIGKGGTISAGCILTTNITIGDYVSVNVNVTIGHDSILEDYVSCSPKVAIAGNVLVRTGAYLGIGSVIKQKISIAPFVTIGAQACVVKNITNENITIVGIPAKLLNLKAKND